MKKRRLLRFFHFLTIFALIFSLMSPAVSAQEMNRNVKLGPNSDARLAEMEKLVQHQMNVLQTGKVLHESLEDVADDEWVEVIVQLSEEPVALAKGKKEIQGKAFTTADANSVVKKVKNQQVQFERHLKAEKISFEKGFTYNKVLNGMSLKVKGKDLEKLAQLKEVVKVDPNDERYALDVKKGSEVGTMMDRSNDFLNIPELWARGITGKGVKVAVLDTGIDYEHPDLKDVYKGGFNFVEHNPALYKEERAEDDPYETAPDERAEGAPEINPNTGRTFYTDHGTHVAGTIAAQGKNKHGIKGIAPEVELYAYRVLGAYGSGTNAAVIAGIEKAVDEGMDVINLSLGGGSSDENTPDAIAINNAVLAGVTAVVSNGNSGPGRQTVTSPASAVMAISVGNSTVDEVHIRADVTLEAEGFSQELEDVSMMAWRYGEHPGDMLTGEFDVVAVPEYGLPEDYEGLDVEGKVALVSRGGGVPFVDKIAAAKEQGAAAIIIHNNVAGDGPAGYVFGDSFSFIPTFDIATQVGQEFRAAIKNSADQVGKITFNGFIDLTIPGDEVNDSSSRGPSTPNFDIKPDVLAPGTNIMSTIPAYGKYNPDADYDEAYERFTGTSMSAPHVTGIVALLLSANPDWDPFDVKVALSNTAKLYDTNKYDVFAQGAGRVDPVKALQAEALAYVQAETEFEDEIHEHEKGTVTFGRVAPDSDSEKTIEREIVVRSLSDAASEYSVEVEVIREPKGDLRRAKVTVDKTSFTLGAGEEETLTATLTIPTGKDSPGEELLGYIHISNGKTNLSLPFAVEFSEQQPWGIDYFYLDDYAISPNGDGVKDATDLHLGLLHNEDLMSIELWDVSNPYGGLFGDGYIGIFALQDLPAGQYYLRIDGTYLSWESVLFDPDPQFEDIPDGVYTVDYNSWSGPDIELLAFDGPLYVKRSAPEININVFTGLVPGNHVEVTGAINDKFVEFKDPVERVLGLDYDVNNKLDVTYVLKDGKGDELATGKVQLDQDGKFSIPLRGLVSGNHALELTVEDIAGNSAQAQTEFTVDNPVIVLTPSTTARTVEPVTISVDVVASLSNLVELKWLEGEKEIDDFANAGNRISLKTKNFTVERSGIYTVYARTASGAEAVAPIAVNNIIDPDNPFDLVLTATPEDETDGPVTVQVSVDETVELDELKWLPGALDVKDFADAGEAIDQETMAFEVTENGTYTVYAKDNFGFEVVAMIGILNIKEKPITISLSQTPEEITVGPVTINVAVDSARELEALKWLPGEKAAEDFVAAGNDIDLNEKSFDVSENGVYTVYARNVKGVEAVATINVENIVDGSINLELSVSPKDKTIGPVTITADVQSDVDLVALKWLPGKKNVADFADAGNTIDLETKSFAVTENGFYTVYAKNAVGTEVVAKIKVKNIVDDSDDSGEDPVEDPGEQPGADPGDDDQGGKSGDDKDDQSDDKASDKKGKQSSDKQLPETATNNWNIALIGLVLIVVAGVGFLVQRKLRSS